MDNKYNNKNYTELFENSIKLNWEKDALTDYQSTTYKYCDLAFEIEKLHILFEKTGLKPGDKIAICSRNRSNWAVAFLATITYGAIAVPILHEFKAEQVHHIVNHSDSKAFFVGDKVWETLDPQQMQNVEQFINLTDFSPLSECSEDTKEIYSHLEEYAKSKYPHFSKEDINYYHFNPDGNDLLLINYTSGSTGNSKGVMIPNRSIWSNVMFFHEKIKDIVVPGDVVSMLPMAHMYGLAFEVLSELSLGMHTYFLTRNPSPSVIFKAFADIKPRLIVSVPLIIEKIVQKNIMSQLKGFKMKILWHTPLIKSKIKKAICKKLQAAFGGNFYEIIIGGAAFNKDVEKIIHKIGFNYTVGYGATECGPLITYANYDDNKLGACGQVVNRMEIKINSSDPHRKVGEILCKGDNVMLGYYKNEEETSKALDSDGWFHTGDLGIIDKKGYLYISGRCKNMLLGPSGQNIYPEEIEDKLNSSYLINESVVIQSKKDGKLYGLVYLDQDEIKNLELEGDTLNQALEEIRKTINSTLPAYEQITGFKIHNEEFEKTPKHSIKRFLYFDEDV